MYQRSNNVGDFTINGIEFDFIFIALPFLWQDNILGKY